MPEITATFAQRLALLRSQRQLSQPELAKKIGAGKTTVSKWESGETEPVLSGIRRLAEFFSVSADYLIGTAQYPTILRPGDWLVDLDAFEAATTGSRALDPRERLGFPIPSRFQIVDSTRYAAMDARARDALRSPKKQR